MIMVYTKHFISIECLNIMEQFNSDNMIGMKIKGQRSTSSFPKFLCILKKHYVTLFILQLSCFMFEFPQLFSGSPPKYFYLVGICFLLMCY